MKKLLAICVVWVFVVGCNSGCTSAELKKQAVLSEGRSSAFVRLMDAGQTTREDEQAFIKASNEMFQAIKAAVGE